MPRTKRKAKAVMFTTSVSPARVIGQRVGRIVFGVVLIAGDVLLQAQFIAERRFPRFHAAELVAWVWLAAALAGLIAAELTAHVPTMPRDARALCKAALVVPTVGIALLLPITVHMIMMFDEGVLARDHWAWLCIVLTPHIHIVFAWLAGQRAHALACGETPVSVRKIVAITCAVSVVPLLFVGPIIVGLTGLPIIPLLFWMERIARIDLERSHALPVAIARTV
jgi:hypothetical protein